MNSQLYSFDNYLNSFKCEKGNTKNHTHTRIADKDLSVYGGSYIIPENQIDTFYEKYYQNVFIKKKQEYLTEKQLIDDGPLLVDIDLHYNTEIDSRQHTKNHIVDLIELYADTIAKILNIKNSKKIPIFILEKPNVNMLDEKTKDGIHLIIGIKASRIFQLILRDYIVKNIADIWDDIPIMNSWDMVLDEGITKGHSNWQLYGSRKPGNEAYQLSYVYYITYDEEKKYNIEEISIETFNIKDNFKLLSAQYKENELFDIIPDILENYTKLINSNSKKPKLNIINKNNVYYEAIDNNERLDIMLNDLFDNVRPLEYELKEIHNYVMILPEAFYGVGSYSKWIRVGWALKNTSNKLFLTWVKFSSQSPEFSYEKINEMKEVWDNFEIKNIDGLTSRSIIYWAKTNAEESKYIAVRNETIDYFINQSIDSGTEFDLATVLFNIFKDRFICASIKSSIWYEYIDNKWEEIDSGNTLRLLISKNMHDIYLEKSSKTALALQVMNNDDPHYELARKRANKLLDIAVLLKKTSWKNNIMREAQELF